MKSRFAKIRFSKAEHEAIKERADADGTTVSALLRDAALDQHKDGAPHDALASEIKRDIVDMFELFEGLEWQMREVLLLLKELLSRTDPQAVARIAGSCKRPNQSNSNG